MGIERLEAQSFEALTLMPWLCASSGSLRIARNPFPADAEMAALNIQRAGFHGEWNYTISPAPHSPNRAFIS